MAFVRNTSKWCKSVAIALLICFSAAAGVLAAAAEGTVQETAPVTLDGTVLFHVAGGKILPARQRAGEIAGRIRALAKNRAFDPTTLRIYEEEGITGIAAGETLVMGVFPEDLHATGLTLSKPHIIAREQYLKKIVQAIHAYRDERTIENLSKNGLKALLRSAMLAVLMFAVIWLFRGLDAVLERTIKRRIETLASKSSHVLSSRRIWSSVQGATRLMRAFLILVLIYVFMNFVLNLFPWTHHIAQTLLAYTVHPLMVMARAVIGYLPNIFFLLVLFLLVRYLLKLIRAFFDAIAQRRLQFSSFDVDWAQPTYRIARLLVIVLSLVVAYPYIPGSDSEAFKGISLLLGLLLSLGSTSIISNTLAGYSITYRRAYKVGDWVKIGQHVGEITQVRMQVTNLRSLKNETVVIPNSVILGNDILNYSALAASQGLILHTQVSIGYEVPWRQVEAMLLMAAQRTDGLLARPEPYVLQTALGDFAVTYELNVHCAFPGHMERLYAQLHRHIQDVFNEYDVQIMTPHYVADPQPPKLVPRDRWHTAPALHPPGGEGPRKAKNDMGRLPGRPERSSR